MAFGEPYTAKALFRESKAIHNTVTCSNSDEIAGSMAGWERADAICERTNHEAMNKLITIKRISGERGITIIELLIGMAVMGVMSAIVVPALTGFLRTSNDRSLGADRGSLQSAVDGYRTSNSRLLPIHVVQGDTVTNKTIDINLCLPPEATFLNTASPKNNCVISMVALANGGFIANAAVIPSVSSDNLPGSAGSYTWVILSNGDVASFLQSTGEKVTSTNGVYP